MCYPYSRVSSPLRTALFHREKVVDLRISPFANIRGHMFVIQMLYSFILSKNWLKHSLITIHFTYLLQFDRPRCIGLASPWRTHLLLSPGACALPREQWLLSTNCACSTAATPVTVRHVDVDLSCQEGKEIHAANEEVSVGYATWPHI